MNKNTEKTPEIKMLHYVPSKNIIMTIEKKNR